MSAAPVLYLLDTNIVIHYARGKAVGQQVEADYGLLTTPYRPLISVVTKGEAHAFAAKRQWGSARVNALDALLAQFVSIDVSDPAILRAYAELDCWSQSRGRKMGKNDIWIAATAKVAAAMLMTTDGDFDHLNQTHLQVIKIDQNTGVTI